MSTRPTPALPLARRLRRGEFVRFAKPRRLCVRAERGSLWVTVDGEPDDIELDAGQSRVFDRCGAVIVGNLGSDAVLTATVLPGASSWRAPLLALWARLHNAAWKAAQPRPTMP